MCTSIIEIARAHGMAKRGSEWFPLSRAVVAYDHARHAQLGDVVTLDFINTDLDPGSQSSSRWRQPRGCAPLSTVSLPRRSSRKAEVRDATVVRRAFGR